MCAVHTGEFEAIRDRWAAERQMTASREAGWENGPAYHAATLMRHAEAAENGAELLAPVNMFADTATGVVIEVLPAITVGDLLPAPPAPQPGDKVFRVIVTGNEDLL
jgi:hypothetical protein